MYVRCINNYHLEGKVTEGAAYLVLAEDDEYYTIVNDLDDEEALFKFRFEKCDDEEATGDSVNHPNHYTQGIECWDYITSHNMGYLEGNIVKYITRHDHKNGLEDLKKAQAYLNKLIEVRYGKGNN